MPQSPPVGQEDIARARLRFRRLVLLLAILLLLIGGVLWYWRDLHRYHVTLAFDDINPILEPRAAGFLVGGEVTPYSFYDWQGTLRWRVEENHRERYIRAGAVLMETEKRYALSPDGQFLSVIDSVPWAKQVELRTWRKGKPYRKMKAPLGTINWLQQMNDGTVFVSGTRQGEAHMVLWVKGARIAARAANYSLVEVAADRAVALAARTGGRNVIMGIPCAMTIANGDIRLRPITWRGDCSVHDKGIVLFRDGFIHQNGAVKRLVPGAPNVHLVGLSPTRGYAVFTAQRHAMVISPVTGANWSFPIENGSAIADGSPGVSENGRFVAVTCRRDAFQKLRRLYNIIPRLGRLLPRRQRLDVLLYARPGRLVANLSDSLDTQIAADSPWHPSPDGHTLVGFIRDGSRGRRCVLVRKARLHGNPSLLDNLNSLCLTTRVPGTVVE